MKSTDLLVFSADQKHGIASNVERLIRARFAELGDMGKIDPFLESYVSSEYRQLLRSITWLKSARRSSSKISRLVHHPSGISGSFDTVRSEYLSVGAMD